MHKKKKIPHGKGKMVYHNGNEVEGTFKFGLLNGFGIMKYVNGDFAVGSFKNNKLDGLVKYMKAFI